MNVNSFYRYARAPCCIALRLYSRHTCVGGATQCAQRNVRNAVDDKKIKYREIERLL